MKLLFRLSALFFVSFLSAAPFHATGAESTDTQVVALDASHKLTKRLLDALEHRGTDYVPRTEHLLSDGSPRYVNRLIETDSPYLIQHAHNPVNWYPWGEEAFAAAAREDKPVFLSIGYATCHWCHVMERESFENHEIAKILNDHYIAIKVDREQRPDIDSTYMTAVQMISGSGGWPMSSFLMPDAKPFYGGTYYPPNDFTRLLTRISELWTDERELLRKQADELSTAVAKSNLLSGEVTEVTTAEIQNSLNNIMSLYDDLQGGFSSAPKFPQEPTLFLLLEEARRTGNGEILSAAHFTLTQMSAGGLHDQVGGGFHRYSVDNEWLVPHFEKMLYNQAALSRNYLLSYLLTDDQGHVRTVQRTLDYVLREMTSPSGGFYSATDADSEGEEGLFFIWTPEEIIDVLGIADAKDAMRFWNVTPEGNFESKNILHLDGDLATIAADNQLTESELADKLDRYSEKLLQVRNTRIPPLLDDKIITEWNGMMITAFAEAGEALGRTDYVSAAIAAAEFIWTENRQPDGRLWRAHFAGSSSIAASQSDYAFMAEALLALFDVTHDPSWLDKAVELTAAMNQLFWDEKQGGYFIGSLVVGGAALPVRPKDLYDNATPSGNAVALRVLTRLWHRTGDFEYLEKAETLVSAFSSYLSSYPTSFGYLLTAASELLSGETGHRQYAAKGKVRIEARRSKLDLLSIDISVAPGWHINADKPLQDYLIGTKLTTIDGGVLEDTVFPKATRQKLGFERSELALYDGDFSVSATLPQLSPTDGRSVVPLLLQLQACDDKVCLAPETLTLNLSVAANSLQELQVP